MDEIERLQAENRRLRAQAERAREDLELLGERLGYALHQVAGESVVPAIVNRRRAAASTFSDASRSAMLLPPMVH